MNRSIALRSLWWKELRQLWPLIGSLIVIGFLLQVLFLIRRAIAGDNQQSLETEILLAIPALYSVGAGALLIGQEKEQRTLGWLSSLPIAARDIVKTKLLAGLTGLVAAWLVAAVLAIGFGALAFTNNFTLQNIFWLVVHSCFLLLVGFATAWKIRSSFVSLLVLIPLACIPTLVGNIHQELVGWYPSVENAVALNGVYAAAFAVVFLTLGWRAGIHALAPQVAPRQSRAAVRSSATIWQAASRRASPFSALVWQFAAQNRLVLGSLLLLFAFSGAANIASLTGFAASSSIFSRGTLELLSALGALGLFLSCSWLGLLVFQSDTMNRRVVFLADRGIAPWKVWMTRQLLPIAIACTCGIALLVLLRLVINEEQLNVTPTSAIELMVLVAIAVFVCSQWIGQLVRSPIVAAILSPFVSVGIVLYGVFAGSTLIAPIWILTLASCVGLLATFVMTRRWMDQRVGWTFWFGHGGFILLAAVLPLAHFMVFAATYPSISRAERSQLLSIANRNSGYSQPIILGRSQAAVNVDETDEQVLDAKIVTGLERIQAIQSLAATDSTALLDAYDLRSLLPNTILSRLHLAQEETPDRISEYRESIRLITDVTRRFRASPQWAHQDQADRLEIWLLEELQQPQAKQWMGEEVREKAAAMLRDKAARDDARRRAIALSWSRFKDGNLGGYNLHDDEVSPQTMFKVRRNADLICANLLSLVDATGSDAATFHAQLAQLTERPGQLDGEQRVYIQGQDGERMLLYDEISGGTAFGVGIGSLVNRDWERTAAEL
jgi:hypothetical protein